MQIRQFNINDYANPVALAIKKMGGVKKAAKMFVRGEVVIQLWIRKGYVTSYFCAEVINDKTDVPIEDLYRKRN